MWSTGGDPAAHDVEEQVRAALDPAAARRARDHIARILRDAGVTFEGSPLGVSLFPTVLAEAEVDQMARAGRTIRAVLCRLIAAFRAEHRAGDRAGLLHALFAPYERWWDAIAAERRRLPEIGLMRLDCAGHPGSWRVLETNTACPGGTTVCASARRAWLACELAAPVRARYRLREYPLDDEGQFVAHLARTAAALASPGAAGPPGVAILTDRGSLSFEIELWREQFERLRSAGAVDGPLVVGDVREVEVDGEVARVRGTPVALIHNKLNPIDLDPSERALAGWLAASRLPGAELLNSLGALYLTEAKRVLACVRAPAVQDRLDLDAAERETIARWIPATEVIAERIPAGTPGAWTDAESVVRRRPALVIKPDALSRGEGVHLGRASTDEDWRRRVADTVARAGVAQEEVALARASAIDLDGAGQIVWGEEHLGVEVYYVGSELAGLSSRASRLPVCNVGAGGRLRPVLVLAGGAA